MARVRTAEKGPLTAPAGAGSEEEALLAPLALSPRLGRVLTDLESIVNQEGFLHFTTDDVAQRLRCSKTTLYRIAGTREELFDLMVELPLARIRDAAWRRVEAADNWPERLSGALRAPLEQLDAEQMSFAFWRDVNAYPSGHRILMAHQKKRTDLIERIISLGIDDGAFVDVHPRFVAETLARMVRELLEPSFVNAVGLSLPECLAELDYILEHGLLPRSPTEVKARGAGSRKNRSNPPKRASRA